MTGWTFKGQWLNLLIFLSGLAGMVAGSVPDTWAAIPAAMTPKAVLSFLVMAGAYARSVNTEKPRESFRERRGEADAKIPPDTDPTPKVTPLFKDDRSNTWQANDD